MKRFLRSNPILVIGIVLLALAPSACIPPSTPEQACLYFGDVMDPEADTIWSDETDLCYLMDSTSACYPQYALFEFTGTDFLDISQWTMVGCGYLPGEEPEPTPEATPKATPQSHVIIDPERGSEKLGQGAGFGYEALTCDGRCRIALSDLTGAGKRALNSAPGQVIGKNYVQIFDQSGNLDYGYFTLCLYAKGADAPAFYRLGGGNSWVYMGGFWKGNQFCMAGTMSGNYILTD